MPKDQNARYIITTSKTKTPDERTPGEQLKTKPWAALLETIMNLLLLTERNKI
jgi:hypothetical protein